MYFLALISTGVIIGLIVAAPIGPVNLICIRRTILFGPVNGFVSGLGAAFGDGVFAIVTAYGLTAISQWIEGYATPLKFAGGVMLLGFGLHIFNADVSLLRDAENPAERDNGSSSLLRAIASTFALTVANPATLFGFAALFAGLGGIAGARPSFFDTTVMVIGVIGGSTIWWFTITTIVGIFHRHIDTGVMRTINHIFGVLVTAFGAIVLGNMAVAAF